MTVRDHPIGTGVLLAILSAVAFGLAVPFIQRFGAGAGAFTTACLLYLGAAVGALPFPRRRRARTEASLGRRHLPRLALVAFFGAALAPSLFAWGLQRVPATHGSLLLNWEAVFTVGLAALIHREHVGGRVILAALLMAGGGFASLAGAAEAGPTGGLLGGLAILGAVLAWALDNVLTRPLADLDPAAVVRGKALIGAALTGLLAWLRAEALPDALAALGLLACGATGYGLSLRLYLTAQRRIGAARTGSVFAVAPFLGATFSALLGAGSAGLSTVAAAFLFAAGALLHLAERHSHRHAHDALVHDHRHRHDDGHHDHVHDGPVLAGEHAHVHAHAAVTHDHPHGPDVHHGHRHEG